MQRRSVIAGLGLWSLGAAVGGTAAAQSLSQGGRRVQPGDRTPVMVNQNGRGQLISGLVVTDGAQTLGLGWQHGADLFEERRFDLSGIGGGLGSLFRTPFRVRWERAAPAGTVELVPEAQLLVARVTGAGRFAGAGATLAAGDYSWDLPGRFAPAGAVGQGRAVGAIRIGEDGRVLVALPQMVAQV